MALKSTNILAGIPQQYTIAKTVPHDFYTELFVSSPSVHPDCPYCKGNDVISKGSDGFQSLRHSPCAGKATVITVKKLRFFCKNCRKSFTWQYPFQHPWLHITNSLYSDILAGLSTTQSMKQIAANCRVTENIVRDVFDSIVILPDRKLPQSLCIDEFKGDTGEYVKQDKRWNTNLYHCNITSGSGHYVIDILPKRKAEHISSYFTDTFPKHERENVLFLNCDMTGGFASLCGSIFPYATLCVDFFHVIQRHNKAIDLVRLRFQNPLLQELKKNPDHPDPETQRKYELLKKSARLLTTKEANLPNPFHPDWLLKKQERLHAIFDEYPDIQTVYDAVQEFHVLCAQDSVPLRKLALSEWIDRYLTSEVKELRDDANTVKRWHKAILNGLEHSQSNGVCEGLNKKIKDIKRNGSGFRNFENLRKRILLACGRRSLVKEPYSVLNDRRNSSPTPSTNSHRRKETT